MKRKLGTFISPASNSREIAVGGVAACLAQRHEPYWQTAATADSQPDTGAIR